MSSPWQWLYAGAHQLRRLWYRRRQQRLPRPVISIGNLHWGGSGKTPLTAAVAAWLTADGRRVAILSRGYGRQDNQVRIVSLGDGPLLGPTVAGDEPVLLAGELPGAAVIVGPDRYRAGRHALERIAPPPEIFLLDDGFSHLALARDLDLLVAPASDPLGGGKLWPGGRLREPLAASRHAAAILVTGGSQQAAEELATTLRPWGFTGPGFGCARIFDPPRLATGETLNAGTRVLLVSAVARPQSFETAVTNLDLPIAGALQFPDHHPYPEASLSEIATAFAGSNAEVVLTTAKDRVKLLGRLDLPLAELPLRAVPDAAFWPWLDRRLAEIAPR